MSILDLFYAVAEFWQGFAPWWQRQLLASGARHQTAAAASAAPPTRRLHRHPLR